MPTRGGEEEGDYTFSACSQLPPCRVFRCIEDEKMFCSIETISSEKHAQGVAGLLAVKERIPVPLTPRNSSDERCAHVRTGFGGHIDHGALAAVLPRKTLHPRDQTRACLNLGPGDRQYSARAPINLSKRGSKTRIMTWQALSVGLYLNPLPEERLVAFTRSSVQGLTLVQFSAQRQRFSGIGGACRLGLFRGCL